MTSAPDAGLDIFREDYARCPHAILDPARSTARVQPAVRPEHYVVLGYEEARDVLNDTVNFSAQISRHEPTPPELVEDIAGIRAQGPETVPAMLGSDAPIHTRYRRLVNRAFTPRALAQYEPVVEEYAQGLIDQFPTDRPFDFVEAFAEPFPVMVICRMLGLPDSYREDIRRWTKASVGNIGVTPTNEEWLENERGLLDLHQRMSAILENPTAETERGLLGTLAKAFKESGEHEEPLTIKHLLTVVRELVVAGNETSGKVLGDAITRFGADREVWAKVRENRRYADVLAEETLRLCSPTQSIVRLAAKDVTLAGQHIPAGSTVIISLAGANGDPEYWSDPAELCPERPKVNNHLAFGSGPHTCVGAGLTRLEMQVAFRLLGAHFDEIRPVDEQEQVWTTGWMLRGPDSARVQVTPHLDGK